MVSNSVWWSALGKLSLHAHVQSVNLITEYIASDAYLAISANPGGRDYCQLLGGHPIQHK